MTASFQKCDCERKVDNTVIGENSSTKILKKTMETVLKSRKEEAGG